MHRIFFLFIFSLWFCFGIGQTLPRVIILATGGTIAGQGTNPASAGYMPGKIPIDTLLKSIPPIKKIADVKGEQIASVGSYDMTVAIWLKLAKRINEIFEKNEADGIVITHGTDTQEETAYFLNLTLKSNKPVVLTGAMRAATAISADGPKNLYDAIIVASDTLSKTKGVMICFNEGLYDAKNVTKANTINVDAFASPNTGPIGQVYGGRVVYFNQPLNKKNGNTPFDIFKLDTLPKVEIVYMYVDASAAAMDAFINEHADGIIIAASGDGSFNKSILQSVNSAVKKGISVVRSSRVPSGRVTQFSQVFDDIKLGTVASDNHNPQKARILLMLALTVTRDRNTIQQMFLEY
ncbi:MAG TPA: type II asparaginase [Chitinophagaceae bacterium]|nr:type II asparaginase [Chitinophagaceae bacterium]